MNTFSIFKLQVANCVSCGIGLIKPDVVFFGENVYPNRRDLANNLIASSDLLLCLGSSLQVYSAYRIVQLAKEHSIPIICVNIGKTRADEYFLTRINAKASETLMAIDKTLS